MKTSTGRIEACEHGFALRISKQIAKTARLADGTPARLRATPGRIVVEVMTEPTLAEMLAAFDPKKHGGELMAANRTVGVEAFA